MGKTTSCAAKIPDQMKADLAWSILDETCHLATERELLLSLEMAVSYRILVRLLPGNDQENVGTGVAQP